MKIEIGREVVPDSDGHTRMYTCRTQLATVPSGGAKGMQRVVPDMEPFLAALLDVPGVALAEVQAYHATVTKARDYEWEEIEPTLLRLFGSFAMDGAGRAVEQIDDPNLNFVYDDEQESNNG